MTLTTATNSSASALLEVVCLIAIQALLLWNFQDCLDVHAADEAGYFGAGVAFIGGDFSALDFAWSPLYAIAYGFLSLVPTGEVLTVDVMFALVCLGNTLTIWWALRAVFPSALPFLIAAWWAASPILLSSDCQTLSLNPARPMSNAFGLMFSALAVGLVARRRYWASCVTLTLLFFARPEAAGVLVLAGAMFLFASRRSRHRRLRAPGWLALGCGAILCVVVATHPGLRNRTWFNFEQNYAYVLAKRGGGTGLRPGGSPFYHGVDWTRSAFPSARSLAGAALENPRELMSHAWFNLTELPREIYRTCFSSFTHRPWVRLPALALIALLAVCGLYHHRSRLRALFGCCPLPVWLILLAHLSVLLPLILIQCRDRMLLPLVPLILTSASCMALAGWRTWFATPLGLTTRRAVPLLAVVLVIAGPPLFSRAPDAAPPPYRTSVAILRDLVPGEPLRALGSFMYCTAYLAGKSQIVGIDFHSFQSDPARRNLPFARILEEANPDLVIVTPPVLELRDVHAGLVSELFSADWTSHRLLPGYYLVIRADSELQFDSDAIDQFARRRRAAHVLSIEDDTARLSLSLGGSKTFTLSSGETYAGWTYLLLGTMHGPDPGTMFKGRYVPLNTDAYFLFTARNPNSLISNSCGVLDASGNASARLKLPAGLPPTLAGQRLHHAFVVFRPGSSRATGASNVVEIEVVRSP